MRVKADTLQKIALAAALIAALGWNLAQAAEVRGVHLSHGATGTRAEVLLDAATSDYRLISLAGPDRLVIDLPASSLRKGAVLPAPAGIVRSVRYGQPEPGIARVVFDLAQPVAALRPHIEPSAAGARLVIEWPGDGVASPQVVAATPVTVPVTPAVPVASQPARIVQAPVSSHVASAPVQQSPLAPAPAPVTPAGPVPAASAIASSASSASAANDPSKLLPPVAARPTQAAPVAAAQPPMVTPTVPAAPRALRDVSGRPLRPLVIAIDAGHGGQDPGAIGLAGKREKEITLSIARELARQINAVPGYRAYLTRDADVFLPLHLRTRRAKDARADMFVSIHADAAENRAARGSSVYVLSTKGASSQRARWLADKENAADLIGGVKVEPGNTLATVLLDLTQSGNLRASEDAASQVLSGLGRIGPQHKRSVERANFAVLRTSDIPAMLVETAFISNPEEEQRLADPAHQRAIARAVLDGVNSYFTRQPPPGTLLAARLEAEANAVAQRGAGLQAGGR